MQGAEDEFPVIHSQLHRTFCASACTVWWSRWGPQMAAQTEIPVPFFVPSCSQCGTQPLIVRNSREWPSYLLRTYECPWCRHKMSEVVRSPMVSPPTVAMDRVAQS
jgi:hypothetical protein